MRWRRRPLSEQPGSPPPVDERPLDLTDPFVAYLVTADTPVDLRETDVDTPLVQSLRHSGVELVVPIIAQSELVGVLSLGPRKGGQSYNAEDRRLLHRLASRAAPALRLAEVMRTQAAQAGERERIAQELRVARLIQQQFLPTTLPEVPGWHIGTYYRPAQEVGGDFYDFLQLPDGQIGVVIGDVSGKGVPAALVMATTRSLLREVAQQVVEPAGVLERVNRSLVADIPRNMFVTCQYAAIDPTSGKLTVANAGHAVPYLTGGGDVLELRATGLPLGVMGDAHYDEEEAVVGIGGGLLFHSDGLAEARSAGGEMFGFPRLRHLVGAHPGDGLIQVLLTELASFSADPTKVDDDVTLLTLERTGESGDSRVLDARIRIVDDFTIPSAPGNERIAIQRVGALADELGVAFGLVERLKTAVGEATMNAMEHGNRFQADVPVEVRVLTSPGVVAVEVIDEGGDREIGEPPTPDLNAKLAGAQSPRGWGLFLMKEMVDDVRVETEDGKHRVRLELHYESSDP
jgi:serine phosphatase RsbU (regulator of sigma subunit)/anti-sigma regulatory factor (Ser/Thr protein kinase)